MKRRERGLTLVETLIVVVLSGLLLLMLHQILSPLLGSSRGTMVRAYQSRQAHQFMERFSRDLKQTTGPGLSYRSTGPSGFVVVAICKPERLSDEGQPIYEEQISIYRWRSTDKTLEFARIEPGHPLWPSDFDPSRPARLDDASLDAASTGAQLVKVLARNVESFEPFEEWPIRSVAKASLTLSEKVPGQRKLAEFTLEQQISLRQ